MRDLLNNVWRWRRVNTLTVCGPEMRIIPIPALPRAVAKANIVSVVVLLVILLDGICMVLQFVKLRVKGLKKLCLKLYSHMEISVL